jgi:enoyl-CoA hydratase
VRPTALGRAGIATQFRAARRKEEENVGWDIMRSQCLLQVLIRPNGTSAAIINACPELIQRRVVSDFMPKVINTSDGHVNHVLLMDGPVDNTLSIERRGALAQVVLNRPDVLNALNDEMRGRITEALPELARDPEVYAVIISSNSPRAFCAGGDVRELTGLVRREPSAAAASIAGEYALNWALECFTKPTVSLIDGMVMGSGVGLMLYGTHRVAGEKFRFSMPETAIGFFPDVGTGCVLARMPGGIGRYLGLTGRAIGPAAAYQLGLVTHCIAGARFNEIAAALAAADTVDPILDDRHQSPEAADDELLTFAGLIQDVFEKPTVREIFEALEQRMAGTGTDAEWCAAVHRELAARSPLALCVTLRHLDTCRALDLRETLIQDYRLGVRFLAGEEIQEGVRALLIDKDGRPKWRHASINDVQIEEIEEYFSSLGDADLQLPDREKMQEIRG